MQRIEFDIKYRADIEAGRYKVETRDGRPARIVCWDVDMESKPSGTIKPILALHKEDDGEYAKHHFGNGKLWLNDDDEYDLFLVPVEQDAYTITGWVARDEWKEELWFYENKPERCISTWIGIKDGHSLLLDTQAFSDLTWADEPIEVELTIKRKEQSK